MEEQLPTILRLPASLPYPITLRSLDLKPGSKVQRGQRILRYGYMPPMGRSGKPPVGTDEMVLTWESTVEGEVVQWEEGVVNGMVINSPDQAIIHIQQPCSHPVTVFDMCAICGADMSQTDYMSTPAYSNANNTSDLSTKSSRVNAVAGPSSSTSSVQITHDMPSLRVSIEEAHRLALESRQRLLKAQKLHLVVDLDLTIVHAVADPTVGEWMDDIGGSTMGVVDLSGERAEPEGRKRSERMDAKGVHSEGRAGIASDKSTTGEATENPDADALRDVYRFQLLEGPAPSARKDVKAGFAESYSASALSNRNWYYIKPRPGLPDFLESMSKIFEMHVYTAGSRSYADAVCKCIDPTGKFFNERILSRDESGSAASKDVRRLFPTDQSMVVIIDDRWEVWNHGPNLVKVKPFDFFAGLGDINGAFVQPRATDSPTGSSAAAPSGSSEDFQSGDSQGDASELLALKQAQDIEAQVEDRPLKRKQEQIEGRATEATTGADQVEVHESDTAPARVQRRAVLRNDDTELVRLDRVLNDIHGRFFAELARHGRGYRVAPSEAPDPKILFDVRHIIPHLERKVFAGCVFVFSGIISTDQRPENNEWWFLASMFGARCVQRLDPGVTHLITDKSDTQKVYEALRMPSIKVVAKRWLVESLDMWKRAPEEPYLIPRPTRQEAKTPEEQDPSTSRATVPPITDEPSIEPGWLQDEVDDDENESGSDTDQAVELGQNDFDEMDAELREFLGSEDEESEESGSTVGASGASGSTGNDTPASPPEIPRTPTKSSLRRRHSRSSSTGESTASMDGPPMKKRARFHADELEDAANDYNDIKGRREEEDYDEYVDEGQPGERAEMLIDGEPDDLAQERDDGGVDREMREGMTTGGLNGHSA